MDKQVSKAFKLAEKELEEVKINRVKEIVKRTLEKLENLTSKKKEIEEAIKVLKMDIDDLKAGRLDKIEERQRLDEKARNTSVVIVKEVIREIEKGVPYPVPVNPFPEPVPYWRRRYDMVLCWDGDDILGNTDMGIAVLGDTTYTGWTDSTSGMTTLTYCSSDCSNNVTGTYQLSSGNIKHLR